MCMCEDLWWRFDVNVILYYEDIERFADLAQLVEHFIRKTLFHRIYQYNQ